MIQRKQTLYLLAVVILMATMLFLPLGSTIIGATPGETMQTAADGTITKTTVVSNSIVKLTSWGLYIDDKEEVSLIVLTISIAVVIAVALINIFLFKKRKLQLNICYGLIVLLLGITAYIAFNIKELVDLAATQEVATIKYSVADIFPLLGLACIVFAIKGIKKDIDLLRSLDRIR